MSNETTVNESQTAYATEVSGWLGEGFKVFAARDCAVVGSPSLGVTAAVREGDPEAVAKSLSERLLKAGLDLRVTGHRLSSRGDVDGMLAAMVRGMAIGTPPGEIGLERLALALSASDVPRKKQARTALSKSTLDMLESCAEQVVGADGAWISGLRVPPRDLVSPSFFLPAILVSASNSWTMPVVASGGRGGFLVRLKHDPEAILSYRVTDVEAASPLLLFTPIADALRKCLVKEGDEEQCVLDPMVETFARFLTSNDLDESTMEEVDVRVATS